MTIEKSPPNRTQDEKRRSAVAKREPKPPLPGKAKERTIPKGRIRQGRSRS